MKEKIQIANVAISVIIIVLAVLQLIGKPLLPIKYLVGLALLNALVLFISNRKSPEDREKKQIEPVEETTPKESQ